MAYLGNQVAPDGVEPSFPGCGPSVVAVGPRGFAFKWSHRESHSDFWLAEPASSCWTMTPCGSRGTRTHKRLLAATCFQDRLLIRPDDFRCRVSQAAEAGIEPTRRRSERLILSLDDSASLCSSRHCRLMARSGRRGRTSVSWFKARRPTTSRSPRVPCGNRTRLASLEGWCLCRSAKGTKAEGERVGLSRLIARPLSGRLPSPIGLTFRIQRLRWQESNLRRDA